MEKIDTEQEREERAKTANEICRDCEFRHAYCHDSCEVYRDILRQKEAEKAARKRLLMREDADAFLFESIRMCVKRNRKGRKN